MPDFILFPFCNTSAYRPVCLQFLSRQLHRTSKRNLEELNLINGKKVSRRHMGGEEETNKISSIP